MSSVNGLRCVVTGAASGIGQAVAEQLTKGGATVVSLDRNEPAVPVSRHIPIDVSDRTSIDEAVGQLGSGFDAHINVAGVPGTAPSELVFKVNFLGLRHLTEAMFDRLEPGGAIVNVSSTAGFGWPQRLVSIRGRLAADPLESGLAG